MKDSTPLSHPRPELLELALDAARMGVWDWNLETGGLEWSGRLEEIHGMTPGTFDGTLERFLSVVHPDDIGALQESIDHALATGAQFAAEFRAIGDDGVARWVAGEGRVIAGADGRPVRMIGVGHDISARRRSEQEAGLLADIGIALDRQVSLEARLGELTRMALPQFADACIVDLADDRGRLERVAVAHVDPEVEVALADTGAPLAGSPQGRVFATGDPQLLAEVGEEHLRSAARDEDHVRQRRALGVRSAVLVPLVARGRRIGVLTLLNHHAFSGRPFDAGDLNLAEEIARRAALAIENARLYRVQRHIAGTLQRALLPEHLPPIPGARVGAAYTAFGEGVDAGGDFYDVADAGAAGRLVVVGDVCGKGPQAAALTALARYTLRALARRVTDPAELLVALNDEILHQHPGNTRFLTACVGLVETTPDGLCVRLASGGHPPALLARADGGVELVGTRGGLVGILPVIAPVTVELTLAAGDRLVLYTDGVTEARTPAGALGESGLATLVAELAGLEPQSLASELSQRVSALEGGRARDDVAILVLQADPGGSA